MRLDDVIKHRKGFITIDDRQDYKLCRVQLHRRGVVLREVLKGSQIRTKKQQVCKAGDFLVAEMDAKVGGYGFVPKELDGAIVSSHYFLFELDEKKIRPGFLNVVSKLGILQDQIKATGSTNYAAIRPAHVLNWEIPTLDIQHQIEIEKLYSELSIKSEQLSTELTHQLDLVKQLRQAFLREAMQGKLVPQDKRDEPASMLLQKIKAEKEKLIKAGKLKKQKELPPIKPEDIPFEIPKSWVWCRLGEICKNITKGSSPKWQGVQYVSEGNGILFITSKNVDSYRLDLSNVTYVEKKFNEIEPRSILRKGDLLTNIVGASIGRTAIYDINDLANINQAVCILRIEHDFISKTFILHLMNSDFVIKLMMESQFAPGRANLSMSDISKFTIPLPPLSEQHRIVARLEQLMGYCDELEQSIKESQAQNEHLLQQVLREALRPGKEYEIKDALSLAAEE